MTQKEREDRFIERCRKNIGTLTWEAELLLRYGFAAGASELGDAGFIEGVEMQRDAVLAAMGAAPRKEERRP